MLIPDLYPNYPPWLAILSTLSVHLRLSSNGGLVIIIVSVFFFFGRTAYIKSPSIQNSLQVISCLTLKKCMLFKVLLVCKTIIL